MYAGLPDTEGRRDILQAVKSKMEGIGRAPTQPSKPPPMFKSCGGGGRWASDVDPEWLAQQTQGYSGADLSSLVRNAAMASLLEEEKGRGGEWFHIGGGTKGGGSSSSNCSSSSSSSSKGVSLELGRRHFETALMSTEPSSGAEEVAKHETWARQWRVGR